MGNISGAIVSGNWPVLGVQVTVMRVSGIWKEGTYLPVSGAEQQGVRREHKEWREEKEALILIHHWRK